MSHAHALFELEEADALAVHPPNRWSGVLPLDIRNAVRDILAGRDDFASLASLRMTCKQEDVEQYNWFQMMSVSPECSWAFREFDDDDSMLCLVRPRRPFYTAALLAGHDGLAQWAKRVGYKSPPMQTSRSMDTAVSTSRFPTINWGDTTEEHAIWPSDAIVSEVHVVTAPRYVPIFRYVDTPVLEISLFSESSDWPNFPYS